MVDLLAPFSLEVYRLHDIFLNDLRATDLDNMVSILTSRSMMRSNPLMKLRETHK